MGRKLYVDDLRKPPKGYEYATCFAKAVELYCEYGDFDVVDLDFNLNDGHTGLDLLKWIAENGKTPARINIHASHIQGRQLMREYAEDNFFNSVLTEN